MSITRDYSSLTRKYAKFSLAGVLAVLALVVLVIGGKPESAQAAPLNCPKFRVMHNDKIGNVTFPAGYYNVTVLNSSKLTCAQSTKLFQEFLQDWDGRLRSPWILRQNGENRVFRAGAGSDKGFRATPSNSGGRHRRQLWPFLPRLLHRPSQRFDRQLQGSAWQVPHHPDRPGEDELHPGGQALPGVPARL